MQQAPQQSKFHVQRTSNFSSSSKKGEGGEEGGDASLEMKQGLRLSNTWTIYLIF